MINDTPKKKKHIAIKIFGIIALVGLVLSIVGFALGGRVGTFRERDGRFVYETSRASYDLGEAPYWAYDNYYSIGRNGALFNWGPSHRYTYDYAYEYEYDYEYDDDWEENEAAHAPAAPTAPTPPTAPTAPSFSGGSQTVSGGDSLSLGDIAHLELDFGCGYVTVQQGDTATLTVDGPLEAKVYNDEGILHIDSASNMNNITNKMVNGKTHYFKDGVDITTYYTLTLPQDMTFVEADLGLGKMDITGLSLEYLEATVALGEMNVTNVAATHGDFKAELGTVNVTGFTGESVNLDAELGSLDFAGEVESYIEASAELGSITITVPRPEDYGYNITTSMGSILLDGRTFVRTTSQAPADADSLSFTLQADMGSVEVSFT